MGGASHMRSGGSGVQIAEENRVPLKLASDAPNPGQAGSIRDMGLSTAINLLQDRGTSAMPERKGLEPPWLIGIPRHGLKSLSSRRTPPSAGFDVTYAGCWGTRAGRRGAPRLRSPSASAPEQIPSGDAQLIV